MQKKKGLLNDKTKKTDVIILTTKTNIKYNGNVYTKLQQQKAFIHIMSILTCLGTSRLFWVFISAPVGVRDLVNVVRNRFIIPIAWQ